MTVVSFSSSGYWQYIPCHPGISLSSASMAATWYGSSWSPRTCVRLCLASLEHTMCARLPAMLSTVENHPVLLFEAGQRKDWLWIIVELVSSSEPSPFMALKPEGYTLMGYVPFMWAKKCPKALWGLYRIIGFLTTVLYLTTDKINPQGSNNVVFQ